MPYTYILFSSKLNKYYIGACIDIDRRMYEHNTGHSKFTGPGVPWRLAYKEYYDTLAEAKRRETYIKRMKSRKYVERLINGKTDSLNPSTGLFFKDGTQSYSSDYRRQIYTGYLSFNFSAFNFLNIKASLRLGHSLSKAAYSNSPKTTIPDYSGRIRGI